MLPRKTSHEQPNASTLADTLPPEIWYEIARYLDGPDAAQLVCVNMRMSHLTMDILPAALKRLHTQYESSRTIKIANRDFIPIYLSMMSAGAINYIEAENNIEVRQARLCLYALHILDIMTYLSHENIIRFNYIAGTMQTLYTQWECRLFFWHETDRSYQRLILPLTKNKCANLHDEADTLFSQFNFTAINSNTTSHTRERLEFINDLLALIQYMRIDCSPTMLEVTPLFFNRTQKSPALKIFTALDQAIENAKHLHQIIQNEITHTANNRG